MTYKTHFNYLDSAMELYNLAVDPTEINDLAQKNPDRVKHLEKLYLDYKMNAAVK